MKIKNIIISTASVFAIVSAILPWQMATAQTASSSSSSVVLQDVSSTALDKLYGNLAGKLYNKLLQAYADVAFELDPQLSTIISNNAANDASDNSVNQAVQQSGLSAIDTAFQGVATKEAMQYKLQQLPAGDDVISVDSSSAGSVIRNIFSSGADTADIEQANKQAQQNNAMFDAESLTGPAAYDSQNKSNAASGFLAQINSIAMPTVIRLAPTFQVPIMDPRDPNAKTKTVSDLSSTQLLKLQQDLQQNPAYRDYRQEYRRIITLRSIYLDNLMRLYQERVVQKDSNKSAYQVRNDQVQQRLSPSYYKAMQKASPATVSRETLFVLARISAQLNAIQNQNERIIAMNAVSGMNTLGATSKILDMQTKNVGKMVYCAAMKMQNKDSDLCPSSDAQSQSSFSGL